MFDLPAHTPIPPPPPPPTHKHTHTHIMPIMMSSCPHCNGQRVQIPSYSMSVYMMYTIHVHDFLRNKLRCIHWTILLQKYMFVLKYIRVRLACILCDLVVTLSITRLCVALKLRHVCFALQCKPWL